MEGPHRRHDVIPTFWLRLDPYLRRSGISSKHLSDIKLMFKILYQENLTLDDAKAKIESTIEDSQYRSEFLGFLDKSKRGICR